MPRHRKITPPKDDRKRWPVKYGSSHKYNSVIPWASISLNEWRHELLQTSAFSKPEQLYPHSGTLNYILSLSCNFNQLSGSLIQLLSTLTRSCSRELLKLPDTSPFRPSPRSSDVRR